MLLKAIAFDWGHTLMDERRDEHIPLDTRPIHLMPGVADVLPQLTLPLALWANTRVAQKTVVRGWLDRAGLGPLFHRLPVLVQRLRGFGDGMTFTTGF